MSETLDDLTKRVMQLPVAEQLELAERIYDHARDGDHEAAWDAELARRIKSYESGTEPTYDADEVMAEARARLKSKR
jgi:putative addiction module component (TIGR02574 family)